MDWEELTEDFQWDRIGILHQDMSTFDYRLNVRRMEFKQWR